METHTIPAYEPAFMSQQQHNMFPVVPQASQEFYRPILKSQPKVLGVVQIVLVGLQITLGAILTSSLEHFPSVTALSGINYWGSLLYLTSGTISLLAELKPNHLLVKFLLVSNVSSCLTSFIEFCLICEDINTNNSMSCYFYGCDFILKIKRISLAFLFIATVVQFSLSAFLVIMSWKSLKQKADFASEVCDVNHQYRYFMSSQASQAPQLNLN